MTLALTLSGSQSTIGYSSNSTMEENLDDSTDIINSQGSQPQKIRKGMKSKTNRHARQKQNKRNNSNPSI